jgi:molybdopterin synthase sulfur carrier subunit
VPGSTVAEVLDAAQARYGEWFAAVLAGSRVWLNGEVAAADDRVRPEDEVAVLPPVSGGAMAAPSEEADVVDGPHGRLGLLWAVGTTVAAAFGPLALGLWFAPVAALAAAQAARTWRRAADAPTAGVVAAVIVLGATLGPLGVAAATVVAVAAARLRPYPTRTLCVSLPMALAAAAPVVLRARGFPEAFALLALVWAFDAGSYIVGTGAVNRWEGPAAGVGAVLAVSLAVATVFVPPFEGVTPWVFGLLVAATVPFADRLVCRVLGDHRARVPIVRRLDSLAVAGPPFAALAYGVLR